MAIKIHREGRWSDSPQYLPGQSNLAGLRGSGFPSIKQCHLLAPGNRFLCSSYLYSVMNSPPPPLDVNYGTSTPLIFQIWLLAFDGFAFFFSFHPNWISLQSLFLLVLCWFLILNICNNF